MVPEYRICRVSYYLWAIGGASMATTAARVGALPFFGGKEVRVQSTAEAAEQLSLGEGRTNQNFIVSTTSAPNAAQKFFVRVGGDLPHHGVLRAREWAVQRAAAAQGLAPQVLSTDGHDVMVTEFVEFEVRRALDWCAAGAP